MSNTFPEFIPAGELPENQLPAAAIEASYGDGQQALYEPWRYDQDGVLWYRRAGAVVHGFPDGSPWFRRIAADAAAGIYGVSGAGDELEASDADESEDADELEGADDE